MFFRFPALLFSMLLLGGQLIAAEAQPHFPQTQHDDAVPHPKQVLGFDFGDRIAMHHEIMTYAKALAAASPKVSMVKNGETWEGREMALLFVTSKANQARLGQLKEKYQALADPRKTDEAAMQELISDLPVLVMLLESVHGNEISGADSGILLAWHLASAQGDGEIDKILDNSVLMIQLMQNPDGRDRFIQFARQNRAAFGGDGDPQSVEHDEPWPRGRFNHYLFDMNRDWFAMTQLETQAKVKSFLEWRPHVSVDLHEMGSEATFFAANPSPPANPILPQEMLDQYEAFGKSIGNLFDQRGFDYFQGETFDSFYPGYGESWPSLNGTIGMLFEQGSARGLKYNRRNGTVLTHREAVTHQAVASYAVLEHSVAQRSQVLAFFYNYRKSAMAVKNGPKGVLLLPGDDPGRAVRLGRLLQKQGIEMEQFDRALKNVPVRLAKTTTDSEKIDIPAHAIYVPFNQPAGRLARSLLLDHISMPEEFLERQNERLKERKFQEIYDITAWSLPLIHGVPAAYVSGKFEERGSSRLRIPRQQAGNQATVAWLVPSSGNITPLLAAMLQKGIKVHYNTLPLRQQGIDFPAGSLVIKTKDNPELTHETLNALSEKFEHSLIATATSWSESGPALGSSDVKYISAPSIGLLWDQPTNPMSAGWMRYILEQRFHYPVTILRVSSMSRYDLSKYDVLIMPDSYSGGLEFMLGGANGNIKRWVRDGGVLLTFAGATEWLIGEEIELLDTVLESRGGIVDDKPVENPKQPEKDPFEMILPLREKPTAVSGVLLEVDFDPEHWISFGMSPKQAVLVNSNRIMRPLRLDSGQNPGRFTDLENLLLSGYIDPETLSQFAHKPFVMTSQSGRGMIVAFTEDPNYRAFMDGLLPLVGNAIFLGPTQTR